MLNDTQYKYLYNHTSQETAYFVEDYPWGFRLRTKIRYWIESKNAKNGGQRFASQTINPKTGKWCAPKYSTYSPIIIMFLDKNEHVKYETLEYNHSEEKIHEFKEKHLSNMNEFQKDKLREIMAYCEVMKHVKFEIKPSPVIWPVSLFSKDPVEIAKREALLQEQEKRAIEQKEELSKISKAISYHYNKNMEIIK